MQSNYVRIIDVDNNNSNELKEDKLNVSGILITQQLDGVAAGKTVAIENKSDGPNSHIYGTSVFASYVNGQKETGKNKNTDDKIVIGYTSDGLPFQIIADGFFGGDTKAIFRFIDKYITPLIDDYAEKLAEDGNPEETIKTLIKTIYSLRAKYSPNSEFTMSIGITYEKNNNLHCAGFGIGDTGLVLRKSSGEIQQLTHTTAVNGSKDAFDQFSSVNTGIERVIKRNNIFNVPVNSDDEIFGYTYLFDDLLSVKEKFEDNYQITRRNGKIIEKSDSVVKYKLNNDKLDNSGTLLNAVIKANSDSFARRCASAEKEGKTGKFGDDCMMSTVTIPTRSLQNELKEKIFSLEKNKLDTLLKNQKNKDVHSKAKRVHDAVIELEKTENNLPELTRYLTKSNRALINPDEENIKSLMSHAQKAQGKASIKKKVLGIAMMVFGIALAALGGIVLAGSLAALPTGILTLPGTAGILAGTGLATGGVAMFSAGLGLFFHGRQKGASKNMSDLAGAISIQANNNSFR